MVSTLFSFWGALGNSFLSLGHPFGLECFFHGKGAEKSVESKPLVYFLHDLEGDEQHCI